MKMHQPRTQWDTEIAKLATKWICWCGFTNKGDDRLCQSPQGNSLCAIPKLHMIQKLAFRIAPRLQKIPIRNGVKCPYCDREVVTRIRNMGGVCTTIRMHVEKCWELSLYRHGYIIDAVSCTLMPAANAAVQYLDFVRGLQALERRLRRDGYKVSGPGVAQPQPLSKSMKLSSGIPPEVLMEVIAAETL